MFKFVTILFLLIYNLSLSQNNNLVDCDKTINPTETRTPFNFEEIVFQEKQFIPPFNNSPQFLPVVFNKTIVGNDTILEASFFVASNVLTLNTRGIYISFDDGTMFKNPNLRIENPLYISREGDFISNYLYNANVVLTADLFSKMISNKIIFIRIGESNSMINFSSNQNLETLDNYDLSIIIQDILACFVY